MSKVIAKDELNGFRGWQPPSMGGAPAGGGVVTAKQIEQVQQQAYDEGFAQGRREGLEEVRARLAPLLAALSEPYADLDAAAQHELVLLVQACAQQLVRRELRTNPDEIVGLVREAMATLPASSRDARLHLHPEDAALVRAALSLTEDGERHWRILEDPAQPRGGCRVLTDVSQIDAALESRLATVVARMLGGERERDAARD